MSASLLDLCKSYSGPFPYGPGIRWNGTEWVSVDCSSSVVSVRPGSAMPGYSNVFQGGDALDGSADVGIPPMVVPGISTRNILAGGIVPVPIEEECQCKSKGAPRSLWWLVGIGIALWLM